ncbi:hypothetical protein HMPREF0063_10989 [Aeromicrobium marinum DSM 15272]|uniref:Uncharacterized protein n=1 Tax=Aeromicrobium marinum DSM 15272 TaxID=585531 RepID=E2SAJ9_9ACTN|nr:hypothetical protein HMPREF0063_10989 [Aeromicrobium marinum DSM 15272]
MLRIVSVNDFVPADSKLEAVTRLSALVGAPPEGLGPGSKERKTLLVNLAAALGLTVDTDADKPELARQISTLLGMAWTPDCWSAGHTITLVGLNRLLSGTHREVKRRETLSQGSSSRHPVPARSKLEAVTRISSLTDGPPQTLGPGSKERKSVLTDLADGLGAPVDVTLDKPRLAEALVNHLGGSWDDSCWSTGSTITLEGLNRVLIGAERRLKADSPVVGGMFSSPAKEAQALLAVVADAVPVRMDGRRSVEEMHAAESRHWAQDEWRGFYFEHIALPALVNGFGGGPTTVENTVFDYSLGEIWDLKCHGDDSPAAILNACEAIDTCLKTRGFGLLVLEGTTVLDDGEFREWQREFRVANGRPPKPRSRPAAYERRSKVAFVPARLDAFFFEDGRSFELAKEEGLVTVMSQGRQTDGSPRRPKYVLQTAKAEGTRFHVAHLPLPVR